MKTVTIITFRELLNTALTEAIDNMYDNSKNSTIIRGKFFFNFSNKYMKDNILNSVFGFIKKNSESTKLVITKKSESYNLNDNFLVSDVFIEKKFNSFCKKLLKKIEKSSKNIFILEQKGLTERDIELYFFDKFSFFTNLLYIDAIEYVLDNEAYLASEKYILEQLDNKILAKGIM